MFFIQFRLRQSNHVLYRNEYLQVSNLVNFWALVPRRYIVACDFLILPTFGGLFANCRYAKFTYRGSCSRRNLIGCFVEYQSIKKVDGRRFVGELYQALFFVSLFPPECFTERNENRAWSQVWVNSMPYYLQEQIFFNLLGLGQYGTANSTAQLTTLNTLV